MAAILPAPAARASRSSGAAAAPASGRFAGARRTGGLVGVPLDADHREDDDTGRLGETYPPAIGHPFFQRESDDSSHVAPLRSGRQGTLARTPSGTPDRD